MQEFTQTSSLRMKQEAEEFVVMHFGGTLKMWDRDYRGGSALLSLATCRVLVEARRCWAPCPVKRMKQEAEEIAVIHFSGTLKMWDRDYRGGGKKLSDGRPSLSDGRCPR
eukprot:TRINITY_DN20335_c0_g1_i6.p1 TRINITY_DN20335_c0_g1~~TRINITY_DN20335_c0_g1_i6.p1  ORF type:complete len:110 (+),score=18.51 TRINITY_DN20335_c0_g1_i6:188-517(+)